VLQLLVESAAGGAATGGAAAGGAEPTPPPAAGASAATAGGAAAQPQPPHQQAPLPPPPPPPQQQQQAQPSQQPPRPPPLQVSQEQPEDSAAARPPRASAAADRQRWLRVLSGLALTDGQISEMLAMRTELLRALNRVFAEREALAERLLLESLSAGGGAPWSAVSRPASSGDRGGGSGSQQLGGGGAAGGGPRGGSAGASGSAGAAPPSAQLTPQADRMRQAGYLSEVARGSLAVRRLLEQMQSGLGSEGQLLASFTLRLMTQVLAPVQAAVMAADSFPYAPGARVCWVAAAGSGHVPEASPRRAPVLARLSQPGHPPSPAPALPRPLPTPRRPQPRQRPQRGLPHCAAAQPPAARRQRAADAVRRAHRRGRGRRGRRDGPRHRGPERRSAGAAATVGRPAIAR
jgi:hypothetical protein